LKSLSPLSKAQKNIIASFYNKPKLKISFKKKERAVIWKDFKKNRNLSEYANLEKQIPAFYSELNKAISVGKNLQTAVFSECVYAQALAQQFSLTNFTNMGETKGLNFHNETMKTIKSTGLAVRYCYWNSDQSNFLFQAGGAESVDCALISQVEKNLTMIEFKEPYARTSEPDLPKYGEDGYLVSSSDFDKEYPQFQFMLAEHINNKFNIFDHIGSNEGTFSDESIEFAVLTNYSGSKFADIIVTEDDSGYLVMLPTEHISRWAKLEGEIRPSGRNPYKVWTPKKLLKSLNEIDAIIKVNLVTVSASRLTASIERGGNKISRYKISPLFFVRPSEIKFHGNKATFDLNAVEQLNPSITAKMKFKGLKVDEVSKFYLELLEK
jgi:hypothetical protein